MRKLSLISAVAIIAALSAATASAQNAANVDALAAKAAERGQVRVIVRFAEPATTAASSPTAVGRADDDHRSALRAVQRGILGNAFGAAAAEAAIAGADPDDARSVTLMDVVPMMALNVGRDELQRLATDPRVVGIDEDRLSKPTLIQSTGIIKMTGTSGAWAKGATGLNRVVAVLDTGVNKNHEFLKFNTSTTKVVSEACYNTKITSYGSTSRCPGGVAATTAVGSGADCSAYDGCGHGTHVAGIATGKNSSPSGSEPTKGVAYNAGILAINIFSRFNHNHSSAPCGFGATKDCLLSYDSDQITALERVYALRTGIGARKIASVNMSLGGGSYTGYCNGDTRKPIIDKLRNAGIAVVIAAGNDGFTNKVSAPGCISSATTVGASSKTTSGNPEKVASYSNIGPQVDVLAPGGDYPYPAPLGNAALILSSFKGSNTTYEYEGGTSMAAPHVAGAFAAIKSKASCASKSVAQIETAMKATGLGIHDSRSGGTITRKRIDVAATIASLCP